MEREDKKTQVVIDENLEELKAVILAQELSLVMSYFANSLNQIFKENKP